MQVWTITLNLDYDYTRPGLHLPLPVWYPLGGKEMKWHNTEVSKHYSEASPEELQRREREHELSAREEYLVEALKGAHAAAEELEGCLLDVYATSRNIHAEDYFRHFPSEKANVRSILTALEAWLKEAEG